MKMHPALDKTLGRENLWWSGGTAPHLLNLDTRWRWAVSFTHRLH